MSRPEVEQPGAQGAEPSVASLNLSSSISDELVFIHHAFLQKPPFALNIFFGVTRNWEVSLIFGIPTEEAPVDFGYKGGVVRSSICIDRCSKTRGIGVFGKRNT